MSVKTKSETMSPTLSEKVVSRLPSHPSHRINRADLFEFEFNGRRYPAFAGDTIWRELARRSLPAPRSMVRVVPSMLGADAPLIGAAELALEPVLSDPAAPFGAHEGLAELASA